MEATGQRTIGHRRCQVPSAPVTNPKGPGRSAVPTATASCINGCRLWWRVYFDSGQGTIYFDRGQSPDAVKMLFSNILSVIFFKAIILRVVAHCCVVPEPCLVTRFHWLVMRRYLPDWTMNTLSITCSWNVTAFSVQVTILVTNIRTNSFQHWVLLFNIPKQIFSSLRLHNILKQIQKILYLIWGEALHRRNAFEIYDQDCFAVFILEHVPSGMNFKWVFCKPTLSSAKCSAYILLQLFYMTRVSALNRLDVIRI